MEGFRYLGRFLISADGTGEFSSSQIHCAHCGERHHQNDHVSYYHQLLAAVIVHPDRKEVLPLFPEAITRQDGATKNDCEANAGKRLFKAIREAFPDWPLRVVEDSLSANGPHIKLLKELNINYIISVKPEGQDSLFAEVKNRVLNGQIKLKANNVDLVMKGGRSRWHIENQVFNTLKNQDYEFEHNFGHGKLHLATVFTMLMMLAFLIDQVQQYGCAFFQAVQQRFYSRTSLWIKIKGLFTEFFIESWESLWRAIIYGHCGDILQPNTS